MNKIIKLVNNGQIVFINTNAVWYITCDNSSPDTIQIILDKDEFFFIKWKKQSGKSKKRIR